MLKIDKGCGACGLCLENCSFDAIIVKPTSGYSDFSIDPKKCVVCRECVKGCPMECIIDEVEV